MDVALGSRLSSLQLRPCVSCARHIKSIEICCPFCGTSRSPDNHVARVALGRMSRARWMLVISATGFASCTATNDKPTTVPDSASDGNEGRAEAGRDGDDTEAGRNEDAADVQVVADV